jgi:YopX protein
MQRPIKFRAIRTDSKQRFGKIVFVEGYLVKTPITAEWNDNNKGGHFFDSGGKGRWCIVTEHGVAHEIDIATVGQFTGLLDRNRKEIYEGDVLASTPEVKFVVIWDDGANSRTVGFFLHKLVTNEYYPITKNQWDMEVIGNRFETPELINQ